MSNARLPRRVEQYARVVFDCDGVILDSNELKSEMMGRALVGEPADRVDAFVAYHLANGGVSRYVKFEHYFTAIHPVPDPSPRIGAALARYAELLRGGLIACAELPGVRALLDRLNAAGVPCFVNSGGDEREVIDVLAERGLACRFAGIYGSPRSKEENLGRIEGIGDGRPGLFLGDARADLQAARAAGLDFVFVAERSDWRDGPNYCAASAIPMVGTLAEIGDIEPPDSR